MSNIPEIVIIEGDICKAIKGAIVNAANPMMLGGGGVDGAIHRAAGPELLRECRKVKSLDGIRCPVGQARITPAGNLSAKFVIHAVGPRYRIDENPSELLRSTYNQSLKLAIENNCKSIAFPAISCGAYGYPFDEAATIALSECHQEKFSCLKIFFYLYGKEIKSVWDRTYQYITSTN